MSDVSSYHTLSLFNAQLLPMSCDMGKIGKIILQCWLKSLACIATRVPYRLRFAHISALITKAFATHKPPPNLKLSNEYKNKTSVRPWLPMIMTKMILHVVGIQDNIRTGGL